MYIFLYILLGIFAFLGGVFFSFYIVFPPELRKDN